MHGDPSRGRGRGGGPVLRGESFDRSGWAGRTVIRMIRNLRDWRTNFPLTVSYHLVTGGRCGTAPARGSLSDGCHRDPRRLQDVRRAHGGRRPLAGRAEGLALRLHRPQRLGQDDHAADDHAHPPAGPRGDRGPGPARHPRGAGPDRLPAGGAGPLQEDDGPPAPPLLRPPQGGPPARARPGHRRMGRPHGARRLGRQEDRRPLEGDGAEGPVHRRGRLGAGAAHPRRALLRARSGQRRGAQGRRARP